MAETSAAIPMRPFGKHTDVKISALGLGGHHIGQAADERTAAKEWISLFMHEAVPRFE